MLKAGGPIIAVRDVKTGSCRKKGVFAKTAAAHNIARVTRGGSIPGYFARSIYSPVRVSMITRSPASMNGGTRTLAPVSSTTSFI